MSRIFLITAPSGTGKTTLAQRIANHGDWQECISHTTRDMREGEVEGKTYYFISDDKFAGMYMDDEFAEQVSYNGRRYGISKAEIERVMKTGKDVFIIVEYGGYVQVKSQYPDAVGIFLHMSKEDCMANMLIRGDKLERALERIELYDDEIMNSLAYDYVIKNVRGKQYETENIIKAIISQYKEYPKALFYTTPDMGIKTTPFIVDPKISVDPNTTYSSDWR